MIRIADTDPGGQPPGTSFFVLLPGRPISPTHYEDSAHSEITAKIRKTNGGARSSEPRPSPVPSVISVDSQ
jgi:two-component system sensor histidine kinase MprB